MGAYLLGPIVEYLVRSGIIDLNSILGKRWLRISISDVCLEVEILSVYI